MTPRAAEQVTAAITYHGEGPCWWPGWGGLRWVDLLAGDLLTLRGDGRVDRLHVGDVAAFVRPRSGGGYVVAVERGLALADAPDAVPVPLPPLWEDRGVRMNDGGCDAAGNLWAGSMAYDGRAGGGDLWRVDPRGGATVVLPGTTIANGLAFPADGGPAWFNDSGEGRTQRLTAPAGDWPGVGTGELVASTVHRPEEGVPDGLVLDAEGCVWTALHGAGRVVRLSPEGRVLDVVLVPAHQVTACTLGGADLRDLYITTSRENLADPEPEAGALFRARVEVPGVPVLPFGG
ncbi:gluconolactonase [Actinotalea ferrariae CF5-4]|mgnify:CR=1 FL=1|uniref:Gluconolactonase n=1 Tax=Actinotalea ferrariae CF5-4 TaxID=948458 RepID=A0A021VVD4_9CELL|nr:SMP-30/gluconolactonase/LRE family protein [Actinotalea ferrariae]EYR64000.1 gluconolactonase [Actinotalea ferrariae CF5-4]